jgi:hypothetical protein
LPDNEAIKWLNERHIQADSNGRLFFQHTKQIDELLLSPPLRREAVTALAVNLVGILNTGTEWLLWLKDFSIWSDDIDEIGWKIIDSFAQIAEQPKLDINSSAMFFGPDEMVALKTSVLAAILFMWDAYLVSGDGDTFVRFCHDNHSSVVTRSTSVVEEIHGSQLSSWIIRR